MWGRARPQQTLHRSHKQTFAANTCWRVRQLLWNGVIRQIQQKEIDKLHVCVAYTCQQNLICKLKPWKRWISDPDGSTVEAHSYLTEVESMLHIFQTTKRKACPIWAGSIAPLLSWIKTSGRAENNLPHERDANPISRIWRILIRLILIVAKQLYPSEASCFNIQESINSITNNELRRKPHSIENILDKIQLWFIVRYPEETWKRLHRVKAGYGNKQTNKYKTRHCLRLRNKSKMSLTLCWKVLVIRRGEQKWVNTFLLCRTAHRIQGWKLLEV